MFLLLSLGFAVTVRDRRHGQMLRLMAESWYTTADLKEQVKDLFNVPLTTLNLVVDGIVLQDDYSLMSYGIQKETVVDLIPKPASGGKCAQFWHMLEFLFLPVSSSGHSQARGSGKQIGQTVERTSDWCLFF